MSWDAFFYYRASQFAASASFYCLLLAANFYCSLFLDHEAYGQAAVLTELLAGCDFLK